ncbi:hypothetical protein ABIC37_005438 [Priestia megaterium]|uniref:hypothetical protein n=1 Tax=Priestia megaterium TaxID=1404 RepID=UPI00339AB861
MAKKKDKFKFDISISQELYEWADPDKLQEARKKAVEAAGMVWADETKELTREEDHIDTSFYINSIGYVSTIPERNKSGKGGREATQADVIYSLEESMNETSLKIGSAVPYAAALEKRFGLMARGLDRAKPRMERVSDFQIKKILGIE